MLPTRLHAWQPPQIMTNLGHPVELSRVIWPVLFAVLQTAAGFFAARYLWRAACTRTHVAIAICWVVLWIGVAPVAAFLFPLCGISLAFSLPATATLAFGYGVRAYVRRNTIPSAVLSGVLSALSGMAFLGMVSGALFVRPWILPPSKAEVISLARQVDPEQLRADAAEMLRAHPAGLDIWIGRWPPEAGVPEKVWPKSFDVLKPVLVRAIGWNSQQAPVLEIYLLKEFDSEISIEVVPAGDNQQLDVGAFSLDTPYPHWREKIADGVYWYSTLKPD
jgi:hypothetical protein